MFHMITDNFYYFLISCTGDFSVCSDAAYMRNPENKIKRLAEKKRIKHENYVVVTILVKLKQYEY